MSQTGDPGKPATAVPGTFAIGRVSGVPVRVHWSVLIIMLLIASGLAGSAFPAAYPGSPGWLYFLAGTVAAAVFLLGLLAHEAAHAVVARRNDLPVESITLWLFGGVAQLGGEARSPGAELRIAGVGPLVSLLLGGIFFGLEQAAAAIGAPGLLLGALGWLAGINLLLAAFNLLPGAPLDGGRLLRALLWKWRGDRQWAQITASRAGRALGVTLLAVGVGVVFVYGSLDGIWLALIGWFIVNAATAEERQVRLTVGLEGVRVGDVMTPSPATVPPDISLALFIDRYLFEHRHSTFPVTVDERPIGLLTLSRVKQVPEAERPWTTVAEVACPMHDVAVADPDEPLIELLPRLNRAGDGRSLVLRDDRLLGIVSPIDITRAMERASLRGARSAGSGRPGGDPAVPR